MDKKYYRITCKNNCVDVLKDVLKGRHYFSLYFLEHPATHYFIIPNQIQQALIANFSKLNGVEVKDFSEEQFNQLDLTQPYDYSGTPHLSPLPVRRKHP